MEHWNEYGLLERSASQPRDMQAATSQVQRGEAIEEVAMEEQEGKIKNHRGRRQVWDANLNKERNEDEFERTRQM